MLSTVTTSCAPGMLHTVENKKTVLYKHFCRESLQFLQLLPQIAKCSTVRYIRTVVGLFTTVAAGLLDGYMFLQGMFVRELGTVVSKKPQKCPSGNF